MSISRPWDEDTYGDRAIAQKHMSSRGPWHEAGGAPWGAWDEARYVVRVICGAAHEHQGAMG